MYGVISVIFILSLTITHYYISTYDSTPYLISEIFLNKHIAQPAYDIYATCIDKQLLSSNPFADLKLMSASSRSFVVLFESNPLLQCNEITYAIDFSLVESQTSQIKFQKILMLKALTGETQMVKLPQGKFLQINNSKQFMLILTVEEAHKVKATLKDQQIDEPVTISFGIQNHEYLQSVLSSVFWFSWFNLIGISLISYYRRSLFKSKIYLPSSIAVLVCLIWLSFTSFPSYQTLNYWIKLAMILFVLLVCIKSKLTLTETLIVLFFSTLNQICLQLQISTQILWIIYTANLFNTYTVALGQNAESVNLSVYSFLIQSGFVNPFFKVVHPLALSFIFVNLVLGPICYELIELKTDFNIQLKKTQEKLHSYEVSETDQLFVH